MVAPSSRNNKFHQHHNKKQQRKLPLNAIALAILLGLFYLQGPANYAEMGSAYYSDLEVSSKSIASRIKDSIMSASTQRESSEVKDWKRPGLGAPKIPEANVASSGAAAAPEPKQEEEEEDSDEDSDEDSTAAPEQKQEEEEDSDEDSDEDRVASSAAAPEQKQEEEEGDGDSEEDGDSDSGEDSDE